MNGIGWTERERLLGNGRGQEKGRCTKVDFKHLKRCYMEEGLDLLCVIPRNFWWRWVGGRFLLQKRKGFLTNSYLTGNGLLGLVLPSQQ